MLPIIQSTKARDPVCGMMVDPRQAAGSVEYQGQTYHFCSKGCAAKFQANPEKYLHPQPPPTAGGVEYTCPMHPEVRQIGPGSCPKCGMALEPVSFSAATVDDVNPEYLGHAAPFLVERSTIGNLARPDVLWRSPAVDRMRARDSGGAVGRLADFRAWLGFGGESQPEHVHADRRGIGRGVRLQRCRRWCPDFPVLRLADRVSTSNLRP